jgi:magnesium transporter
MNFQHMPELQYQNGYYIVIGAMVLIGIIMVFYFRKKMVLNRVVIIERIMP